MATKTSGQTINELSPGQFLKLGKVIPSGSLEVRKLASGAVSFYWRVTINGKTTREVIGIYDPSAPPKSLKPTSKGFSVLAAMRAAEALAEQHHANLANGGFAGVKAAEQEAKDKAKTAKLEAAKFTLQALLFDTAVPHEDTKPKMILMKGFTLRVVGRFQEWVQLMGVNDKEFGPDSTLGWVHESELVKVNMELCRLG